MIRSVRLPAILISLALLVLCGSGFAQDTNKAEQQSEIVAPFMKTPPVIDGVIHEDEWSCAKITAFISQSRANHIEFRNAEFWIGYDDDHIYLAVQSAGHPESGLITDHNPRPGDADVPDINMDDCLEFWFAPNVSSGSPPNAEMIYQIFVNAAGAISDISHDVKKNTYFTSWRVKMRQAHSYANGRWQAEFAIDRSSFPGSDFARPWSFRVVRNFKNPWDQSRLGVNVNAFDDLATMPSLRFSKAAPIVKQQSIWNEDHKHVALHIMVENPTAATLPLKVTIGHNPLNQPRYFKTEDLHLAPGELRDVRYDLDVADPESYSAVSNVRVTSLDGAQVYFLREFMWDMLPKSNIWLPVAKAEARAVEVAISHSPFLRKLAVRGSFKNLKGREAVTSVALRVLKAGQAGSLASATIARFDNYGFSTVLSLPEGMNGDYELRTTLTGGPTTPKDAIVTPFERDRFVWEGNAIGISDKVIPPFTPLLIDSGKRSVSSVLKTHTLTKVGLWEQVMAAGEAILASPMTYEIVAGGRRLAVSPGKFTFVKVAESHVTATSSFTAGELHGMVTADFDIDGMMKTTLDVTQKGVTPIDSFALLIPMKARAARLMHPITDDIRINYGGEIDPKQGVVWESKNASRSKILGTFVPYIWIGNEYRGLCWFAESDKDWILDDKRSAITLERKSDAVTLRVQFVNTPGVFSKPAHIVYGLLATPAKPLPTSPAWQNFCANVGNYGFKCRIMGASPYWNGDFYANFPRGRDFTVVRKIAEASKTGKSDTEFFNRLVNTWSEKTHDMDFKTNRAHIMAGGSPGNYDAVMPYTNLRGDVTFTPEWRTFQDEWSLNGFNKRVTDKDRQVGSTDFSIVAERSRQDFLLYYYKQFLENGFDGIYWDNIFLESCFNQLIGPAYVRSDGQVQPFVDIFRSRELTRRMMTLSYQMGKPNISMVHMTNANLIPVFSFAGSMLGWEWRYGMTDFQDRFTPDYIRAVNLPFNNGCIPVQLPGIRGSDDPKAIAWCERTQTGCTVVHQLNVWEQGATGTAVRRMLKEFGNGTSAVTTHRYWDDNPVLKTGADTLKWIVFSKPGHSVIVFCVYGDGGEMSVRPDWKAMGLSQQSAAVVWETKAPVRKDNGVLKFSMKRHDFKVVEIRSN